MIVRVRWKDRKIWVERQKEMGRKIERIRQKDRKRWVERQKELGRKIERDGKKDRQRWEERQIEMGGKIERVRQKDDLSDNLEIESGECWPRWVDSTYNGERQKERLIDAREG